MRGARGYYLYNAHGDVVSFAGRFYKYDAFGNELTGNANDDNPFRYAGEYFDEETETYYLRARYYDPATGRFGAEDPIRDGLNFYTYCNGNPVFFVDPSGLTADEFGMYSYAFTEPLPANTYSAQLSWAEEIQFMIDDVNYRLKMIDADPAGATVIFIFEQIGPRINGAVGNMAISMAVSANQPIGKPMSRSEFEKAHAGQYSAKEMDDWWNIYSSWFGVKTPSASSGVIMTPEIKAPNTILSANVSDAWDDYLGSDTTNINPRTGLVDRDRIFSADGTRSIRYGAHEMNSQGTTKWHFHYETWSYDAINDVFTVGNTLQRIR